MRRGAVVCIALATAMLVSGLGTMAGAARPTQVRGFDGTTIRVAGMGDHARLPGAEWGARGRIARFNADNEIKGIKIEYVDYADDKFDPALAVSEARRLVTQENVFALVGETSSYNPADYLAQQKVPFFGWGYEAAYCSKTAKPDKNIWGFGYLGCQVNQENAPYVADLDQKAYDYVSKKSGKKHPTIALFAGDTDQGKLLMNYQGNYAAPGAGFKVVYAKATVPQPGPISDYTPIVQPLLSADNGKAPDAIHCYLALECLDAWNMIKANGYQGTFIHHLYTDVFVKAMQGTVVSIGNNTFNTTGNAGLDQMKADVAKVRPQQAIDSPTAAGYWSTDMFIEALKKAAKNGKSGITPENVRKIASTQTWGVKDLVGPVEYPASTVYTTPYCNSLAESDGTAWNAVEPFACTTQQYKVKK